MLWKKNYTHTFQTIFFVFLYRNPNAKGLPFWPEYRPDDKSYMNINLTTTAGVNLLETSVEFWDTLREKTRNDAHSNAPMALLYLFCVAFSIGIVNAGIELR